MRRPTSTTRRARSITSIFNDKELIAVDNTPSSPHYGRIYVTYTKFHIQPDGFSDYCPIQLSYTDSIPTENPVLSTWSHTAVQPDNPGGDGTGSSANQFSDPVVERDGTLDVGFVSENCNNSFDPHLLFQRSTDGGQTFLPNAVQIDKAGQYADFDDGTGSDTIPPTHFRAPNTPSLAYSPQTGKLLFVYQNNVNRPTSQADISYQTSTDGGLHWSDAAFLSTDSSGQPAPNDQFFPWAASDENGRFYVIWFDRRLDPANVRINTWQAVSSNDAASFAAPRSAAATGIPTWGSLPAARSSATTTDSRPAPTPSTPCGPTGATMPSARPASAKRTSSPSSRRTRSRQSREQSWPGASPGPRPRSRSATAD